MEIQIDVILLATMRTIDILKNNVFLEHVAILQYLIHMFLIKDEKLRGEIEEIAKEEMKHMHMFASRAVYLGSQVDIKSVEDEVKDCDDIVKLIKEDIKAEEEAVEIYSAQIDATDDDITKKMLELIIEDEKKHKRIFEYISEELEKNRQEDVIDGAVNETVAFLNYLLKERYIKIVEIVKDFINEKDTSRKDFNLYKAIENMKLMGKIGEAMVEKGIPVCFKYIKVNLETTNIRNMDDIMSVLNKFASKERFMEAYEKDIKKERGFTIGDLTSQE